MSQSQKKKIVIYAHYYPPDVASTGQILQDLAEGMKDEFDITVLCTVPSYTGSIEEKYRKKQFYREEINGVHILRIPVSEFTKSSRKSRVKNLLSYYLGVKRATMEIGHQDYLLAISQPPILGGILGVDGKKKLRTADNKCPKLIYCIQDFNPEQIEAVGYFKSRGIIALAKWLDKRSCRKSDLVITVGRDMVETLEKRFHGKAVPNHVMINNWIDEEKIYPLPLEHPKIVEFRRKYNLEKKFVIMYSGNIGLYYDLKNIIKIIGKFKDAQTPDGRDVVFSFVGAGALLDELKSYKKEYRLENVVFIPYQDKDNLIYSLNAADVHWCINAKGMKGVSCPSKFYGICGVQKPVLGVLEKGSEVQMLIEKIGCGRCSEPGDYQAMEENITWFISYASAKELSVMGKLGYEYLIKNLTKAVSVEKYKAAVYLL